MKTASAFLVAGALINAQTAYCADNQTKDAKKSSDGKAIVLGDIKGESTDDKHKDQIILLRSQSRPTPKDTKAGAENAAASKSGNASGKFTPRDLPIIRLEDKSSPK